MQSKNGQLHPPSSDVSLVDKQHHLPDEEFLLLHVQASLIERYCGTGRERKTSKQQVNIPVSDSPTTSLVHIPKGERTPCPCHQRNLAHLSRSNRSHLYSFFHKQHTLTHVPRHSL